jgi:hypothetical protein
MKAGTNQKHEMHLIQNERPKMKKKVRYTDYKRLKLPWKGKQRHQKKSMQRKVCE